ncbi:MAG: hypothetical protein MUP55_02095 [Candidatus Aenigmarchaeota archaeon]|nr:hypothetical protein [Candidatus Aenigmarchaeota archaeon]
MKTEEIERLILPAFIFLGIGILIGILMSSTSSTTGGIISKDFKSSTTGIPSTVDPYQCDWNSQTCAGGCFKSIEQRNFATITVYNKKTIQNVDVDPYNRVIGGQSCQPGYNEICYVASYYPSTKELNCACWKTS